MCQDLYMVLPTFSGAFEINHKSGLAGVCVLGRGRMNMLVIAVVN